MFSQLLKKERKKLNLTQQEVADRLNVTRQTVSSWELGKSFPDIDTLVEISCFYNISLDYLLKSNEHCIEEFDKKNVSSIEPRGFLYIVKSIFFCLMIIVFFYLVGHELGKAWYYFKQ